MLRECLIEGVNHLSGFHDEILNLGIHRSQAALISDLTNNHKCCVLHNALKFSVLRELKRLSARDSQSAFEKGKNGLQGRGG